MSRDSRLPGPVRAVLLLTLPEGFASDSLVGDLAEEYRERLARGRGRALIWLVVTAGQIAVAFTLERVRLVSREVARDIRFALRSFRRSPLFTMVAVGTLAVGLGATTSVLSVADALLFRPLPLGEPESLVRVHATDPEAGSWRDPASAVTYLTWRDRVRAFRAIAAYRRISYNLLGEGVPERIASASVTPDFFEVLDVPALLGRLPVPLDTDGGRVAVLSHDLWRSRFGGDRAVLGTSLDLSGFSAPVVGVLPPHVSFPPDVDLFVTSPYRVPESPTRTEDMSEDAGAQYLSVLARLTDGSTLASAQEELDAVMVDLQRRDPDHYRGEGAVIVPLQEDLVGDARGGLVVLLGAVGFVLLVACANVANLLTVRASLRGLETSVRMALGAGVGRLRRQFLTESLLLAVLGAVPGLALATLGTRVLVVTAPADVPRLDEVTMDPRIFLMGTAVALLTGLLFGLAPSVGLSRRSPADRLRGGRDGATGRSRLRDGVIVGEVAVSLILLLGAGLMGRTFTGLLATDPGFEGDGTLVAHVSLPLQEYEDDASTRAFFEESLAELGSLPGVESAATVLTLPMDWAIRGTFGMSIEGRVVEDVDLPVGYQTASPGYFATLGIPVLAGRGVLPSDGPESEMVAVINDELRDRYWPGQDPLGARITFWGDPDDPDTPWARVVGVVGNTALEGLDGEKVAEAYMPAAQLPMNRSTFVIKASGDPYAVASGVREAVARVDDRVPLYGLSSMNDVVARSLGARRFQTVIMSIFAALAVVMAAVGLYGVLSFTVSQRFREIGVRKALGAPASRVVVEVVRYGSARVVIGLALGLAGAVVLRGVIAGQIYGVSPVDPLTYASATAILGVVGLLACWIPAARAAGVDPLAAIRAE